jgi:hypothetical protein
MNTKTTKVVLWERAPYASFLRPIYTIFLADPYLTGILFILS